MENKKIDSITPQATDFAQWYTDVVIKSGLAAYSNVKGCMYVPPYGTALWENIKTGLDAEFRATGHENVMMPLLIPEGMFNREKEHIQGFAPEVAWVTHGGSEKLAERLLIRPTSEVLFCDYYANTIQSWRDLPKLYNQWCNVVRWEKTTRPFLRTTEFFWQEGHTVHETEADAREETQRMFGVYANFAKDFLAMPVIKGQKTESEKFAGAVETYTIEAMMADGKALQAGTSHYLGSGFAKAFGIKFTGRDGKIQTPHQTSWGVSTRMIGGIIMCHGDNNGLALPPYVAPIQVVVVPVMTEKPGVTEAAKKLADSIKRVARTHIDLTENTPGWKFAEYEMKGVPLRVEIGPRDIANGTCVVAMRTGGDKLTIKIAEIEKQIPILLKQAHEIMYNRALERLNSKTYDAKTLGEMLEIASEKPGFIRAPWCGSAECEKRLKNEAGITSRCIIENYNANTKDKPKCAISGKPAKHLVIWGKAY